MHYELSEKHVWKVMFHAFEGGWEHQGGSLKKGPKRAIFLSHKLSILEPFFGNVGEKGDIRKRVCFGTLFDPPKIVSRTHQKVCSGA